MKIIPNLFSKLQSDLAAAECKASALDKDHVIMLARAKEAESLLSKTTSELEQERVSKKQETELLARKVILIVSALYKDLI